MARHRLLKRKWPLFVLPFVIVVLLSLLFIEVQHVQQDNTGEELRHFAGSFSVDTPEKVAMAASEGAQAVFYYGQLPAENSQLGQKLQALQMQVVDGFIASYLYYYECHRTKTVKLPPLEVRAYCVTDSHPELSSEDAVLDGYTGGDSGV